MNMNEFFKREDVKALQEIQKRHAHGTLEHRAAYDQLDTLVRKESGKSLAQLGNPY